MREAAFAIEILEESDPAPTVEEIPEYCPEFVKEEEIPLDTTVAKDVPADPTKPAPLIALETIP
jgi:hypothetical protein